MKRGTTIYDIIAMKCVLWNLKRTFVKEGKAMLCRLCEYRDYLQHYEGMLQDLERLFKPSADDMAQLSRLDRGEQERCEREQRVLETFVPLFDDFKRSFERECEEIDKTMNMEEKVMKSIHASLQDRINAVQPKAEREKKDNNRKSTI